MNQPDTPCAADFFLVIDDKGIPACKPGSRALHTAAIIQTMRALSVVLGLCGLALGLLFAPASAQQGETYRIMLVHVPASWISLLIFALMASLALFNLLRPHDRAWPLIQAMAPSGAWMAFLSLVSGALWGVPTWGSAWVWDARLVSMLVLFLLYLALVAARYGIANQHRACSFGNWLLFAGSINLPVIHFSVHWWPSLHQQSSMGVGRSALLSPLMSWSVLLICAAITCHTFRMVLLRLQVNSVNSNVTAPSACTGRA